MKSQLPKVLLMRRLFLALAIFLGSFAAVHAQDLQSVLQVHADEIAKPSRKRVGVVLDDLVASRADGLFFLAIAEGDALSLTDVDSGATSEASKSDFKQLKPNGGVRRVIGTALVQFQLSDPDLSRRETAVASIARKPEAAQLAPLLASIEGEADPALKARKTQLANFLSARFAPETATRIVAIESLSKDTSVEARSVLNQILTAQDGVSEQMPEGNVAATRDPTQAPEAFYAELVAAGMFSTPFMMNRTPRSRTPPRQRLPL